jgi:hypothetical protein
MAASNRITDLTVCKQKIICFFFVMLTVESQAQEEGPSFDIGGYLKYLFSYSDNRTTGQTADHLLHGRLNTKWYASDAWTLACEIRARAYAGGSVEKTPQFIDLIRNNHEFAHLDAILWDRRSTVGYTEIDRLWADWNNGRWEATLGRQRFALGTNLVWNPTDLFNPYSILDFDYEERPGFDGVHVQYYLGPVSKIEIASKPGKTSWRSTSAAVLTLNAWQYDFHILAARRSGLWLAGGSWAGDIAGAGFRGEATLSQRPAEILPGMYDASKTTGTMSSIAISLDYTFPNTLYFHFESLYNSAGATRDAGLFAIQSQTLGLLLPSRWSLYEEVSYDITPLIRGSVFLINNPTDGSLVALPSVTWSVVTNLDFTALAIVSNGNPLTEFGGYGRSGYLRFKWAF